MTRSTIAPALRPPNAAAVALAAGLVAGTPTSATAQTRTLILDRPTAGARAIWAVEDLDNPPNGIQEPAELSLYFDATNTAGTPAMVTPASLAVRPSDGAVAIGDSSSGIRGVFILRDSNRDNSAQGFGESWLAADLTNASGVQLNAPLGLAWGPGGDLFIANSGATGTQDAVYRLRDLDADGRYQGAGEIAEYVGAPYFGPGNSAAVPINLAIDARPGVPAPFVGYFKDSGSANAGVYRFRDADGSGRADDPGETAPFITAANASGVPVSAGGLPLSLDPSRPDAVYFSQIVSAPAPAQRQIVRARDLNADGDAQDAGEAEVVWSTIETLTIIDLLALPAPPGGPPAPDRIMLTDLSGGNKRIILLTDADGDGLFDNATERTTFYDAVTPGSTRQLAQVPRWCQANCDGSTAAPILNVQDFSCFLTRYAAGDPYANCDGSSAPPVLNVQDFSCFLTKYAAGCP